MLEELPLDRTTTRASSRPSIHHHATPQTETPPSIPDGGYGWVCTICVAVINAHSWGINTAYGVFLAHYISDQTFPGASRLEYALVGSLTIGCTLLISPLVTIIVRKFGTKPTMLCGALIQSISLICASLATKIWHLFLTQGVLFGIGMGLLFLPSVGLVAQWFTKRLALASGITNAGAGLGGLTYSLCTGAMIQNLGLIWTLRILSLVTFIVNITFTALIKDRYKTLAPRQLAFDTSLFRRFEYVLVLAFGAFSMLGYFVLIFALANYANEIGLDASQAAIVSSMFSLGQTVGRPVLGHLGDSLGRINMATFMTLLAGILSLTIWVNAKTYGVLLLFSLLGGIPAGTFWHPLAGVGASIHVQLTNRPANILKDWELHRSTAFYWACIYRSRRLHGVASRLGYYPSKILDVFVGGPS
ncbi:hypothetical protein FDECE_18295 [Fusarium decemcellulare]|nr:hypothetical protein FDECE_18295 [Fusarium decemcellulare]